MAFHPSAVSYLIGIYVQVWEELAEISKATQKIKKNIIVVLHDE